jgi:hypothetical protein
MPMNFPDTPAPGDVYSSGGVSWTWTGSTWKAYSLPGAGATVSDGAPSSNVNGNLWWNSTPGDGQLYIRYNDGTSWQWVVANNLGAGLYLPLIGGTIAPGPLVINANAAAPQPLSGSQLLIAAADGTLATVTLDAYGTGQLGVLQARTARGTAIAPTALQVSDYMFVINTIGRGVTGYGGSRTNFSVMAAENWTDTAQGTQINFATTPNGTTTPVISLSLQGNAGCRLYGTQTNDNAPAGYVGEYLAAQVLQASAITLSNGVVANVTSLALTAGDWDVDGNVHVNSTASAISYGAISLTAATFPDFSARTCYPAMTGDIGGPMVTLRVSTTGTTVYLVVYSAFSSGTTKADGVLRARRVR